MKRLVLSTILVLFAAKAEAAPAAPTAPMAVQSLGGPVIQGVCLISQQGVLANSKIGVVATARLKEISDLVRGELDADRARIDFDAKAIETQRSVLKPEEFQQKQQDLMLRLHTLEQTAALRSREIEATRVKAVNRIITEAQPVIAIAYKAKDCGLLLDRNSVLGGNMVNDLTAQVVKGLDDKLTAMTFDREDLSQPAENFQNNTQGPLR